MTGVRGSVFSVHSSHDDAEAAYRRARLANAVHRIRNVRGLIRDPAVDEIEDAEDMSVWFHSIILKLLMLRQ